MSSSYHKFILSPLRATSGKSFEISSSTIKQEYCSILDGSNLHTFLNQVHAGCGRRVAGFLKLLLCGLSVCVCVCPPPRLLIISGVMWHDIDPIQLVQQVL